MDYSKADSQLQGRNKLSRKVGNNTYLVRWDGAGEPMIRLKLHDTYIITWYADGRTELNSGGWRTVTTKARINEYLETFSIYQTKGQWYVQKHNPAYVGWNETPNVPYWLDVCMFEDGLTIAEDGTVMGGSSIEDSKKTLALRRKVNRFATAYAKAFAAGEVKAPGLEDCMFCGLRTVETHIPLGEAVKDKDHLLSHLDENYFVPSILARAMETLPKSKAFEQTVHATWADKPEYRFFKLEDEWFQSQVKKIVSRYMLRQLGQAA